MKESDFARFGRTLQEVILDGAYNQQSACWKNLTEDERIQYNKLLRLVADVLDKTVPIPVECEKND